MKKLFSILFVAVFFAACQTPVDEPIEELSLKKAEKCTTIQSGTLVDSKGLLITMGYDDWGYNYQAHMFNGYYDNYSRPADIVTEGTWLQMKWNDAWLSNQDCDGDGELDRHLGFDTYIGSGAWLTNHESGVYEDADGNLCEYDYFVKIVAAPADATLTDGIWYDFDGNELGYVIWNQFIVIQEQTDDPCGALDWPDYTSPDHKGLGNW